MFQLLKSIGQRLKVLFMLDAVAELETEFVTRQAERKAELFRQATRYQETGQNGVADFLRQEAGLLSHQQPLQQMLPALNDLSGGPDQEPDSAPRSAAAKLPAPRTPVRRRKR